MKKERSKKLLLNTLYLLLVTCCLLLVFCSCSKVPGKLLIIEGNFYSSQGMYNKAISSYLKAMEYPEAMPYAKYCLGTVYFTMGEEKASLAGFTEALNLLESASTPHQELSYSIYYNTGVVLFSGGEFSGAADSFREALKINGKKADAKRNLELSLLSLERQNASDKSQNDGKNESKIEESILYEYIRETELAQWRNRDWPEDEISGPDY